MDEDSEGQDCVVVGVGVGQGLEEVFVGLGCDGCRLVFVPGVAEGSGGAFQGERGQGADGCLDDGVQVFVACYQGGG